MGKQIIKQPNGKFCLYSSIVDNITHYDMTPEEIIDEMVEEQRGQITRKVNNIINHLNNNGRPYFQFTMSYEEMLNEIENFHGKKGRKEMQSLIEKK